jgi:hypothetical protein
MEDQEPARVLIWVGHEQEKELLEAYELAIEARQQGGPAAEVAEKYLVENAIRLHRQAEGMPFEGVKASTTLPPRDITIADEALVKGQVDELLALLKGELEEKVRGLFHSAWSQQADRHQSIEAGRRWVDAYVRYLVFVHGIHGAIEAGPEHGVAHVD